MLFNNYLNRVRGQSNFVMRMFMVLPLLSLLTSCATSNMLGQDRILFSDSSAKVGPLVAANEQLPMDDQAVLATSDNDSLVDPIGESPVSTGKTKSGLVSSLETKPAIQATESSTVLSPEESDAETLVKKEKPAKPHEPKSPNNVVPKISTETENKEVGIEQGAIAGKVILLGENGQPLPATGTLITLTPKTVMSNVQNRPSKVHVIDMQDKEYKPRYSTISAGDQVVFANKDNIQHNVFSSSGSNAFDLGTYGSGLKRAVTLREPGIVKVYCNIHADMAMFVAVGKQGLSVKADDQGGYKIDDVRPGTYEVTIWNIRGEAKQTVEVKANETVKLIDRIDTVAFKTESHKNKFGGDYSKNSALFEDEFY
ncbi:plastocyanin/azurin family copper-binding protein [Arenicella xantha]|uniref:Polysaccharide lyase family 4-like protein n=1 Tax=Arenicella xantha TaxID=644221 RepID=A0A395JFW2_9GAMM|nr:plastocyanin/azurin family copper-binding protein [Arenicella xantha]RBP48558.1 polysaccharide lyase family 4-like protein [Arenicella xantha]